MTDQEIREAIEYLEFKVRCGMFSEKHSKVIKTLAEQYLAVQAKMPRTKEKLREIIATVFDYGMSIEEIPSIKRSETITQALTAIIELWEKEKEK